MEISNDKTFFRQAILELPASGKVAMFTVIVVLSFPLALLCVWMGNSQPLRVQAGSEFLCEATLPKRLSTSNTNRSLLKYEARVHDTSPLCKKTMGSWNRRAFSLHESFGSNPLLASGQAVVLVFGLDLNADKVRVIGVRSPDGKVIAGQDEFNRTIEMRNGWSLVMAAVFVFMGCVAGALLPYYLWRARREAAQSPA